MSDRKPLFVIANGPSDGHFPMERCPTCGAAMRANSARHPVCSAVPRHRPTEAQRLEHDERVLDHLQASLRRQKDRSG